MAANKEKITFAQLVAPMSIPVFWLTSCIFSLLLQYLFVPYSFGEWSKFFTFYFFILIIYFTQSVGNSVIRKYFIDRFFSWEKTPLKKLIVLFFSSILYAGLGYAFVATIFVHFVFGLTFPEAFHEATFGIKTSIYVAMAFIFIFATISFYINWQRSQLKAKKLEADLANYRYESLKKQVNPHFLFNSLNVLADLVHEDADLSENYIHQLSKIYRYVLESAKKQTVPLKEEIEFITSYAFLLDIRFDKKLKIVIDVNPKVDEFIIPVSLQTLIENAVKHNEVTKLNPLSISITQKDNLIIVKNNLQVKKTIVESSGTGLENLKQQYSILTDQSFQIEKDDRFFTVTLPILKK